MNAVYAESSDYRRAYMDRSAVSVSDSLHDSRDAPRRFVKMSELLTRLSSGMEL